MPRGRAGHRTRGPCRSVPGAGAWEGTVLYGLRWLKSISQRWGPGS